MQALSLHTGAPTLHWGHNTSCISVIEYKIVAPRFKHIYIPVFFKKNLTIVFLFPNIISLVSCQNICAPNHVQFKMLFGVINGWMG